LDRLGQNQDARSVRISPADIAVGRWGGDTPGSDDVGVSQNELAAMSNMSRQTTGNLLRALAAAGYLDLGYRSIVLRDAPGLQALLDA
jgi:CRP-like cAMP-binding protein